MEEDHRETPSCKLKFCFCFEYAARKGGEEGEEVSLGRAVQEAKNPAFVGPSPGLFLVQPWWLSTSSNPQSCVLFLSGVTHRAGFPAFATESCEGASNSANHDHAAHGSNYTWAHADNAHLEGPHPRVEKSCDPARMTQWWEAHVITGLTALGFGTRTQGPKGHCHN